METISDSLRKYFEEATEEEIEKDWEELKHWNEIGSDASEYIEHYRGFEDALDKQSDYIRKKRKDKNFYYQGKEVSWEEIPYDVRKHDYPYYFKNNIDYYPFKPNVNKQRIRDTVYTCDNCPHNGDLMCCHNCPDF